MRDYGHVVAGYPDSVAVNRDPKERNQKCDQAYQ
jgi:hypothetical protein